jgi:hypothetical protein
MEQMPISPVDFILGIRDGVIERFERSREIHVWARPRHFSTRASNHLRAKWSQKRAPSVRLLSLKS